MLRAVEVAGELIATDKFDDAEVLIEQSGNEAEPQLGQLAKIVHEYDQIDQRRKSARGQVYEEQLAELEKFQSGRSRQMRAM
jgi:hypothetical protein